MTIIFYASKQEEPKLNDELCASTTIIDIIRDLPSKESVVRIANATNGDNDISLETFATLSLIEATKFCAFFIENRFPVGFFIDSDFDREAMIKDYIENSRHMDLSEAQSTIADLEAQLDKNKLHREKRDYIESYLHGRCHLFALVAANLTGEKVSVMWDLEAEDGEGGYIDEHCLVHAYIKTKEGTYIFDAEGLESLDDHSFDYPCNEEHFTEHDSAEFTKIINQKNWGGFDNGEYAKIEQFIKDNYTTELNLEIDRELSPK